MHPDWYEIPVFYFSNPYATIGPNDAIRIPPGSNSLDYELEIAAVVGRGGSNLSPEEAERRIAGFTPYHERLERSRPPAAGDGVEYGSGQGKDFATSLGPVLVTPDELASRSGKDRAYDLTMTASVNGVEYRERPSRTSSGHAGDARLRLARNADRPGPRVGSGTCGTGCILELSLVHGEDVYPWLRPGDVVELSVDQLGTLRNHVVAGEPLRPLR